MQAASTPAEKWKVRGGGKVGRVVSRRAGAVKGGGVPVDPGLYQTKQPYLRTTLVILATQLSISNAMDQSSQLRRPTGIPRLSRLPLPKSPQEGSSSISSDVPSLRAPSSMGRGSTTQNPLPKARSTTTRTANRTSNQGTTKALNGTGRDQLQNRNDTKVSATPSTEGLALPADSMGEEADDFPDETPTFTPKVRKSRPSLSDRTMETLSKLPPTPATSRRRSDFFSPGSPSDSSSRPTSSSDMRPGSRPSSSMSNRRPSTREGPSSLARPASPAKGSATPARNFGALAATKSSKRSVSAADTKNSLAPRQLNSTTNSAGNGTATIMRTQQGPKLAGSHTIASRSPKPKPALGGLFQNNDKAKENEKASSPRAPSSSAALRQQIAKAKAAKRAASLNETPVQLDGQNDFGFGEDPFSQLPSNKDQVLKKRIKVGRTEGRLNIAALGLKEIPASITSMYDYDPNNDGSWNESVDLTRLIAADNEFETIPDSIFPDISPEDVVDDEDSKGLQFGGLELLDLRGNVLESIPVGVRRLERLTSLNISRNKLDTSVFDIISQISNLRELRLGENGFDGPLPDSISQLKALEVLELQQNKFSRLPESLKELIQLRILNVAENSLENLPIEAIAFLPLAELLLGKNNLAGALFPVQVNSLPRLQKLDVSNNSLSSLDSGDLLLPSLQTLNISFNRITSLPNVSNWTALLILNAEDNRISNLPEGLTSLSKMKSLDFTGNELRHLDPGLGLLESLDVLQIAANPIKERKLLSMSTEDIKQELRGRLDPQQQGATDNAADESELSVIVNGKTKSTSSRITLKPGGTLDLSSRSLSSLEATLDNFDSSDDIRTLVLRSNTLTAIPTTLANLSNLRILDLSRNKLATALEDSLHLTQLQSLNISFNSLSSLNNLTSNLSAPHLQTLDVSSNRLTGALPPLRSSFPALTHLVGPENQISEVPASSLEGFTVVNLANNDIEALDPRIGLLWDEGKGLKNLEVAGNKFRVPGWRVLEKGTASVMAWLRDRIPEE
ncbi:MAG: hypothetical protein M1820_010714 [Bogoriella megaspora]|nr:MAG: hypothetical protein M1820_010714 [Bogoriella megaspora]